MSFYVFDKGPNFPPMPKDDLLDCHLLTLHGLENQGGNLVFSISYDEPIQYPPEYYLHFSNVTITGEGNWAELGVNDYKNITFRGNRMIFNVITPFGGRLEISAKCGSRVLTQQSVMVENLYIYYTLLSRMEWSGTDVARYKNICLENNTLTFMKSSNIKIRKEFEFDGEIFKVNERDTTFEEYMNETNATFVNQTSYFIADFNGDVFHDYFAILNPILSSFSRDSAPKNSSFILAQEPQNDTISRIHRYVPGVDVVRRSDGVVCYRDLVFTSSRSTVSKEWFDSLLKIPFKSTISRFKLRTIEEKKVVVIRGFKALEYFVVIL